MRQVWMGIAVAMAIGSAPASAQTALALPVAVAPSSAGPATPACCLVPATTPVEIEVTQLVTSRTGRSGDRFSIRLARDLVVDGKVVMAAGGAGMGEVIDGGPAGMAGRPGKLVLAARWIEVGGVRLPLRSFRLAGSGRDDSKTSMTLSMTPYVGLLALGIQGGNIDYPPGTRAIAKVASDTFIPLSDDPPANPSKETIR